MAKKNKVIRKIHRNDPCPCGSTTDKIFQDENGKDSKSIPVPNKYKDCCWEKNAHDTKRPHRSHLYNMPTLIIN